MPEALTLFPAYFVFTLKSFLNWPQFLLQSCVICISVFICFCLSLARLPGTEIAGVGANWFLIWVVSWSLRRSPLDAAIGGVTIGLIMDGLTGEPGVFPTHILGFTIVAVLAALLQKERYIQEDFVSAALIVFGMAVLFETIMAIQFSLQTQTQLWLPFLINPAPPPSNPTSLLVLDPLVDPEVVNQVGFTLGEIWTYHQRLALSSAIVSSLWTPIVYYPLSRFWVWNKQRNDRP
ncbi:MAG: hypothetical protein RLZZ435_614 [Cyanobacteriota bacterium]